MGNGVECQRCCNEEKRNEVDVSKPLFQAHSSQVLRHDDDGYPTLDSARTPRSDAESPQKLAREMLPFGQLSPNSTATTPEFGSPRDSKDTPVTPRVGANARPRGVNSPRGRRTVADWASDQDQFKHLPALPAGWIRVTSSSTGAIYYCCQETGETTFQEPTDALAARKNNDLPPGWSAVESRTTGRTYYWNSVLQKSQFEKPVAADGGTMCLPKLANE
jgi:YHS domain-containing protein